MTGSAGQIVILPRNNLTQAAWYLFPLAIIGSLAMTASGFANSDILTNLPWTSVMARQVGIVGLGVVGAVVLAIAAERRWRLRMEASLAAAGVIALIFVFGAAPVMIVGAFLISAAILGIWLSARLGANGLPLVFVTTFGVAIYAIVFSLIGAIRINTLGFHSLLLVAPLVIAVASPRARQALSARAEALAQAMRRPEIRTAAEIVGLAAFLFVAALHALLAAFPERYWDPMVVHLYIPSYVSAHGAWDFDVGLYAWAVQPAAVDWIYTHLFILGGEMAARFYNFTALMLLCATLFAILRRETSREVAIWMAVLLASMPLIFIESSSLFIENTLTLYVASAVGIILAADLRPTGRHAVVVLVILAAATMAKLHGALAAAVIGLALLALVIRQRPPVRTMIRVLTAALVLAAVGCVPYAKAWISTGNPLFPYYNHIFKSPFFPTLFFIDTRWIGNFNWSLLYDTTFASGRFCEVSTGALGLTMLFLVPLAVAAVIARPSAKAALCFAVAVAIWLPIALEIQYLRYFYPVFPLLFVPAGIGAMVLFEQRYTRALTLAIFAAVAAFNIYKLPSGGWILNGFDLRADFDPASRRNLELAQVPERIANRMINDAAGEDTRVLYTGNPYGALLQGRALYTDWYNLKLANEMKEVATPEQAKALLARWAVTHVVHTRDGKKPGQQAVGEYLAARFQPMAQLGSILVYDVRPAP